MIRRQCIHTSVCQYKIRAHCQERGYVMLLVAVSALALLFVIGLALGTASWYLHASKLQRMADAAALAGASALPDTATATNLTKASLASNGVTEGPTSPYVIDINAMSESVRASVTLKNAATAFGDFMIKSLDITRSSKAVRPFGNPAVGSPYNVLGTGDLDIPGLPQRQNFWLSINGECTSREDGDYFSSLRDYSKGPFGPINSTTHMAQVLSTTHTDCPNGGSPNPAHDAPINGRLGYSYFFDVPAPPVGYANPEVKIAIWDPTWCANAIYNYRGNGELSLRYNADGVTSADVMYMLYDTNGTPDDPTDDSPVYFGTDTHPIGFFGCEDDLDRSHPLEGTQMNAMASGRTNHPGDWFIYAKLNAAQIGNGRTFRLQVMSFPFVQANDPTLPTLAVNNFAIGAFANWVTDAQGGNVGCDSRTSSFCPRAYGRGAVSVYATFKGAPADTMVDMYFAEVDPNSAGSTVNLYMFDPGEGSKSISILGPDGNPMSFNWTSSPPATGVPYSGNNVPSLVDLDQGGGPSGLSNDFKFNDTLVTIALPIPSTYGQMVTAAGGNKWLKIRYVVGSVATDRVTWGASVGSGPSSPPHLVKG